MVKFSFYKDIIRDIKKSATRFLGMFTIVALGVFVFAGLGNTGNLMKQIGNNYYQEANFADIKVVSPMGLSEQDLTMIRSISNVAQVQGSYTLDAIVKKDDIWLTTKINSIELGNSKDAQINQPTLLEGRYPSSRNEVLVEPMLLETLHLKIGDTLELDNKKNVIVDTYLETNKYEITGTVQSPLYFYYDRGSSTVGSGRADCFVLIPKENFIYDIFTEAYVNVSTSSDLFAYGDEYKKLVGSVVEELKGIGDTHDPKWYVLDREFSFGYEGFSQASDTIEDIGRLIPLLFFLVAALISLTTMTRLVDEQRTKMGTFKALGYNDRILLFKYLFYAIVPTLLGSLLGGYLGLQIVPQVIINNAYGGAFALPAFQSEINLGYWLGGTALAIFTTSLTTIISVVKEMKEQPLQLMRPKAPEAGKKTPMEYIPFIWKRFSFSQKVIYRNIFRYKKRLFMTLVGVGGCASLLLTGLALRDSLSGIIEKQYTEISNYDMVVLLGDNTPFNTVQSLTDDIMTDSYTQSLMLLNQQHLDINSADSDKLRVTKVTPQNNDIDKLIHLRNRETQKNIELGDSGVVITEKLAQTMRVNIGDEIVFTDADDETYSAIVSGICETYFGSNAYMSSSYYQKVFNKSPSYNAVYIQKNADTTDDQEKTLSQDIMEDESVIGVSLTQTTIDINELTLQGISLVVWLIIVVAAALAFVVLLNLTSINLAERHREVATIEVLGFRDREVSQYFYRENLIVSFVASLIGVFIGQYIHIYILESLEMEFLMFKRGITPVVYLGAILITMAFAVIVMIITTGKLKKINMIEALKSVE